YTGGTTGSAATIEITGNNGVQQFSFASGTTVSSIATAVNVQKDQTGVSGTFATDTAHADGKNASVSVNGGAATVDGKNVSFTNSSLDMNFTLDDKFNAVGNTSFKITGGGATFSLGAKVTYSDQASIGIGAVTTGSLGSKALGYLNSLGS